MAPKQKRKADAMETAQVFVPAPSTSEPPKKKIGVTKSVAAKAANSVTSGSKLSGNKSKPSGKKPPHPLPNVIDIEGLEEWEDLSRRKCKGLGLHDPIKAVEVCLRLPLLTRIIKS